MNRKVVEGFVWGGYILQETQVIFFSHILIMLSEKYKIIILYSTCPTIGL